MYFITLQNLFRKKFLNLSLMMSFVVFIHFEFKKKIYIFFNYELIYHKKNLVIVFNH